MKTIHCPYCGSDRTEVQVCTHSAGSVDGVYCHRCDKTYNIHPADWNKRPVEYQLAKRIVSRLMDAQSDGSLACKYHKLGYYWFKVDRFGNLAQMPSKRDALLIGVGKPYDLQPVSSVEALHDFRYLQSRGFLVQHEEDKSLWRLKDEEDCT